MIRNNKPTLYRKGGELYYKKGGKMCRYQVGGPINFTGKFVPDYKGRPGKYKIQGKYDLGNFNFNAGYSRRLGDNPSNTLGIGAQYAINPNLNLTGNLKHRFKPTGMGRTSAEVGFKYNINPTRQRLSNTPKFQRGGSSIRPITADSISNVAADQVLDQTVESVDTGDSYTPKRKGKGFDTGQIGNYANMAGSLFSTIDQQRRNRQQSSDNPYIHSAFGGSNKGAQQTSGLMSTATGVVSAINPMIGGIVNAGRGLAKTIRAEDKDTGIAQSAFQHGLTNLLSPSTKMENVIKSFKKGRAGAGVLELLTGMPVSYYLDKETEAKADKAQQRDESRKAMFSNNVEGNRRNDTIYAKYGKQITNRPNRLKQGLNPNAEIEDGEYAIGNPKTMFHGGDSNTSNVSEFGAKFHGDKHGQDTDGDGQEGIPIEAEEGTYIASNFLGMNGKKAKKGEKTVAKEIEPIMESLAEADDDSQDAYKSNPQLVENQLSVLNEKIKEAETNKAKEKLKQLTRKKDINPAEIQQFIQENAQYLMSDQEPTEGKELPKLQKGQQGGNIDEATEKGVPQIAGTNNQAEVEEPVEIEQPVTNNEESPSTNIGPVKDNITPSFNEENQRNNPIQAQIEQYLDPDIFDEEGGLSEKWINKLITEHNVSRDEAEKATIDNIISPNMPNVRNAIGKELRQAIANKPIQDTTPEDMGIEQNNQQNQTDNKMKRKTRRKTSYRTGGMYQKGGRLKQRAVAGVDPRYLGSVSSKMAGEVEAQDMADLIEREKYRNRNLSTTPVGSMRVKQVANPMLNRLMNTQVQPVAKDRMSDYTKAFDPAMGKRSFRRSYDPKAAYNPALNPSNYGQGPSNFLNGGRMKYPAQGAFGSRYGNDQYMRGQYPAFQQGGPMPEQEMQPGAESSEQMQMLAQQAMAQDPNAAMAEDAAMQEQGQGQGQVPQPIMQLDPSLQQVFMQLPPEQQEQVLSLPPDQMEIALMTMAEQMGGQMG